MVDVSSDVHNWMGSLHLILCISNWGKLCSYSSRAIIGVIDLNNYKPWIPDRHFNCSLCNLNKLNTIYLFIAKFPIKKKYRLGEYLLETGILSHFCMAGIGKVRELFKLCVES